jgi:hypothetical protein
MSPRAACRLEALGFAEVYDCVAGEADWLAHNLPLEGHAGGRATAGRVAHDDVVTCAAQDRLAVVREWIARSPYRFALVTTSGGVVLGRLRASALESAGDEPAERLMEPGPSTVRPRRAGPHACAASRRARSADGDRHDAGGAADRDRAPRGPRARAVDAPAAPESCPRTATCWRRRTVDRRARSNALT